MANEITVTAGLKVSNGNLTVNNANTTKRFDQTTARGGGPGVVAVGTAEETISFGDITPGFVRLTNLDSTNYVEFGTSTGNLDFRLLADGGLGLVYLNSGASLIMQADAASCDVMIEAVNQ